MTNGECYSIAEQLNGLFQNDEQRLPARVNFYITQNVETFFKHAQALDQERYKIIRAYCSSVDEISGNVSMTEENRIKANEELRELYEVESNISFRKIPLSWLEGLNFTPKQMQILLFMIEED